MNALRPELQDALAAAETPRITVVRSGGLGDSLLTLPVVRLFAEHESAPAVTFVGSAWAERLRPLLARPVRIRRFDGPEFTPLFAAGAPEDPSGAFAEADAAVVFCAESGDAFVQNARQLCPGPVVVGTVRPPGGTHAARCFVSTVTCEMPGSAPLPALRTPPDRLEWARSWIECEFGRTRSPLALHPGSGGRRKCWPAGHFAAAARAMERPVLLVEGPADRAAVARVRACMPGHVPVAAASGVPLTDLAALLCRCHAFLGNDSGVSHLAGMMGIPTVAVFGPTDPAVWAPLGPNVRTLGGRGTWPEPSEVVRAMAEARD